MRWKNYLFLSLFIFLIVLLLNIVSATFSLGIPTYNLEDSYDLGDKIQGWVNISFNNDFDNSTFVDNFGNTITLKTLLDANPEYQYTGINGSITATPQLLVFNNLFIIPGILGEMEYELNFSNFSLFKQNITINSPQNLTLKVEAARKINDKKQEITSFNLSSDDFTGFVKEKIDEEFNIASLNNKINDLELAYSYAYSDGDYQEIIDNISLIKIPKQILGTNSISNMKFFPEKENINLNVLAEITGEDYSGANENSYLDGIFIWSQDTVDVRINFQEISASYGLTQDVLFRYFEVTFMENPQSNAYLIIEDLNDLDFSENYNQKKQGNYYYINLGDISYNNIYFTTTENVDFLTLPMFISPALAELPDLGNNGNIVDGKTKMKVSKWIFFGLLIAFLLVLGTVVYSIVSVWYDKKYENYLFPNRNNLYNLIIFINNSKSKGVNDEEIVKSLKKSKWSNEQIKYVMKKYAGKRTGMAKLPFQKIQRVPRHSPQQGGIRDPGPMRGPSNVPGETQVK